MLVAIPFCAADQPHAERLLDWIGEIGSYPNHDLILFRERNARPLTVNNKAGFRTVQEVSFIDSWGQWPISTTNAFANVARHVEHNSKEPFLFLEPDCIVMTSDWLDEIEKEYKRAKRPFMGAYVPQHGDVPEHLSGVSVYPGEVINYAGQALMLDDTAPWDTAVGNAIVRQAHCTDLIQHHWRHPGFKSMEEVRSRITSECRLWHSDKSGSLIELLRNNLSGGVGSAEKPRSNVLAAGQLPLPPTVKPTATTPVASPAQSLPNGYDPMAEIKKRFTSPLAKGRIMKQLKAAPIIKT